MNIPRLQALSTRLRSYPSEKFSMDHWELFGRCCTGSVAGHMPEFNMLGYIMKEGKPYYFGSKEAQAFMAFFDISYEEAKPLIHCVYDSSPIEIAERIDKLIAGENHYPLIVNFRFIRQAIPATRTLEPVTN